MAHALKRAAFVTSTWLLVIACASARSDPEAAAYRANWARPMASDPAVRSGKFDNGFSYYLLRNAGGGPTELWLDVHAGSIEEAAEQRGYASLLAQLAIAGVSSRPEQSFWRTGDGDGGGNSTLECGFDDTIYRLQSATGEESLLSLGLDSLRMIAREPPLAEADPEQVLGRWPARSETPAWLDALTPLLLQGSLYADRVPGGGLGRDQYASPDQLRQFHDAWYRPERMAVIAVGDFDPARMEAELRRRFADWRVESPALAEPTSTRPSNFGLQVTLRAEASLKSPAIRVLDVVEHRVIATKGQFRDAMAEVLARRILRHRLHRRFAGGGSALSAKMSRRSLTRDFDVLECSLSVRSGAIEPALTSLFQELGELESSGFTHDERVQAQRALVQVAERARHRQRYPNRELAEDIQDGFETGEAIRGSALNDFWVSAAQILPTLRLSELKTALSLAGPSKRRLIDISAPHAAELPGLDRVFALKAQAESR